MDTHTYMHASVFTWWGRVDDAWGQMKLARPDPGHGTVPGMSYKHSGVFRDFGEGDKGGEFTDGGGRSGIPGHKFFMVLLRTAYSNY